MATLGGDSKSDQALFALLAAQAAHEAAKTTLAAGQSGTRNSTLSRLDSLWAARRTRDSSELLQAVSEWIANEDVAAAAAWFWLTEPIQPSGAPVHVRSSRIHALFGSLRASSRGKSVADFLFAFTTIPEFDATQMVSTLHGPKPILELAIDFGYFELAGRWLDLAKPGQWDLAWIEVATAAIQSRRIDDNDSAASFLLRLRTEQVARALTGLELRSPLNAAARAGQPAPCGSIERHGAFLSEYGSLLLAEWAVKSCFSVARNTLPILKALLALKSAESATAQQTWQWLLDQTVEVDISGFPAGSMSLARFLIQFDHIRELIPNGSEAMVINQAENDLWPWLETAESFQPTENLEKNGRPLVILALHARSHVWLAERWARHMAHELVDPQWAHFAMALHAVAPPDSLSDFVATVRRAAEQHALSLAVRDAECRSDPSASPSEGSAPAARLPARL